MLALIAPYGFPLPTEERLSDADKAEMVALVTEREARIEAERQAAEALPGARRRRVGASAGAIPCKRPADAIKCLEDSDEIQSDKVIACDLADRRGKWHQLKLTIGARRAYVSLKDRGAIKAIEPRTRIDADDTGLLAGFEPSDSHDHAIWFGKQGAAQAVGLYSQPLHPAWSVAQLVYEPKADKRMLTGFCTADIRPRGVLSMAEVRERGL